MDLELNGFRLKLTLSAVRDGEWFAIPLTHADGSWSGSERGARADLRFVSKGSERIDYRVQFFAFFNTRLRIRASLEGASSHLFHLIPGNIHGDNNAAHVRPGEFPCLAEPRAGEQNRAALWEFRADRASHPVSILCNDRGAVGLSIEPYCDDETDQEIINGVFAALPNEFGVSVGYGNDPLTFVEKTHFIPATCHHSHGVSASGTIFACEGPGGRREAHRIIRALYEDQREIPKYKRSHREALRSLADSFITCNWSDELQQYTNRKCKVIFDTKLEPWRAIVEIGWTGGSMLAHPFAMAERLFPDLTFPKTAAGIFDEICEGYNERSGLINDATINRSTKNRPAGWNDSEINGWWSGFLPQTRDAHCAYTNAHAAYYLLRQPSAPQIWTRTALKVLDTAIELQRADGAYGYIFSSTEKKVIDYEGFAGCWFAAAMALAWKLTGEHRYRTSADRALDFYAPFVCDLTAWGSPMDTYKSVDSEGNLAFIRAARHLHEFTGEPKYLDMLIDGANYEYLWRYGFRTRPQCEPLKNSTRSNSSWNSCGGTITSVSNPHIHPMGVVATDDLEYLARQSGDSYHQDRADDGLAWLMNTMELYPDTTGYGRYGVLSERTCPSDGLLVERYYDKQGNPAGPASTWWSYNAWAAGSAMEALAQKILSDSVSPQPKQRQILGAGR